MFPIAGQTAGPNGLTFFEENPGVDIEFKKSKYFFLIPRATPGTRASSK